MPSIWFVTGASSGIGQGIIQHLLTSPPSSDVVVIAAVRSESVIPTLFSAIASQSTAKLDSVHLDLADPSTFATAIQHVVSTYGKLDYFVGCAGIGGDLAEIEGLPREVAMKNFEVNLFGTFGIIQAAVGAFRLSGGFKIFQITSETAVHPFPGTGWYGASKAALENLLGTYAQELSPSWNIKVHCIALGAYLTRMSANITVFPVHPAYVGTHMESVIRPMCMDLERPTALEGAQECLDVILQNGELPFHLIVGKDSKVLMGMEKADLEQSLAWYDAHQ